MPGTVLGTVGYMSPEQLRGHAVDKRTDIWSFGCSLYEMLSGATAFPGDTISDMIAAILSRDPDWGALPPATPVSVRRLLRHCLDKDPKQRLRDIGDARIDLRDTGGTPGSNADIALADRRVRRLWWWVAAASVTAAMLFVIALVLAQRDSSEPSWRNPLANARFTRLTDFEGAEHDAAISPDGKFVAFRADRDGPFDVWLGQIDTGRFVNLTRGQDDEMRLGLRSVGFSSDGSEIWLSGGPDRRVRLMPLMGGTSRVFLGQDAVNIAWSPDGARLAYHTRQDGDPLYVADRNGANERLIFVNPRGPGGHTHYPTWSPDGRWIYFVAGIAAISSMDLWRISSTGGIPERLTQLNTDIAYPTPIDNRTVLYVAPDQDGSGPWLWVLDLERRMAHRASVGLEKYISLAASTNGGRLVATVANPSASLWTIPILDRPADERDSKPFPLPTVNPTLPRFGGGSLFYSPSGGSGLWRYHDGQAVEIWKGADGTMLAPPSVSPDGRRVAIAVRRNGRLRLHVLSADGAELQALTEAIDVQGATCWSPDGRWIVTGGDAADGPGLFKVPVSGGAPTRLFKGDAYHPVWSPDGSIIAYVGESVGAYAPLLAVSPAGTPITLPPIQLRYGSDRITTFGGERARFLPDGKGLVYMQGLLPQQDFWLLDLTTHKTRQLTHLRSGEAMRTFDVTPDGKHIVFDRSRENSDIVLIELPADDTRNQGARLVPR
jgi:Tol biopolymer transport system component